MPESALVPTETGGVPAVMQPESLVEALRVLQEHIPGFTQLTISEERSMTRAAHLDPAFIEAALHAAAAWHRTKAMTGMTAEELRQEEADVRRWDEVERALRALTRGVAAANLKRKHRLGTAVLTLYSTLGIMLRRSPAESDLPLRPYYDDLKRAFLATRKKARTAQPKD